MRQTSFEGELLRNDLTTQGYTLVEHGISTDAIDELIAAYATFTDELPDPSYELMSKLMPESETAADIEHRLDEIDHSADTETQWHKYRTNHPQYAKPGGYTNRSLQTAALAAVRGIQLEDDPKEFYHFHPNNTQKIKDMHEKFGWGPLPPEVYELHSKFMIIHAMARKAVTETYSLLEEDHPELLTRFTTPEALFGSPIRLLFYHNGQGNVLAGGHYDKSLGTIQIAESHLGLRALDPGRIGEAYSGEPARDPRMQIVERPPEKGVFFISRAWLNDGAYPGSELLPTWHDVINIPELNEGRAVRGRNCARWAIIFFTDSQAANTGRLDKTATHSELIELTSEEDSELVA